MKNSGKKQDRVKEKLQLSTVKLDSLLKITIGINDNLSTTELLELFSSVLLNDLRIGKICLFVKQSEWNQILQIGKSECIPNSLEIAEIAKLIDTIQVLGESDPNYLRSYDVIIPIHHKNKPLAFLLLGDFDGEKLEVSPIIKHLHFIQTISNIIMVALENKRLYEEEVGRIAMKKELELARKMQQQLIPSNLVKNESYFFTSLYQPHGEIGGDYFDVIPFDDNKIAFCIADVSGKGVSAALLMANFQANIRALLSVSKSAEELIIKLNKRVIESSGMEKFITLFLGIYDPSNRKLISVNAGHIPPMLLNNNELIELKEGCTLLGMFDPIPEIVVEEHILGENAKLMSFTDGITEVTNELDEEFGIQALEKILRENTIENIAQKVTEAADNYRGKVALPDDITLLSAIFY